MSHRTVRARAAASVALVALVVTGVVAAVHSSFTSTVRNGASSFRAGEIHLSDDAPASALFSMSGIKPGDTQSRCVTVRHTATGGLASTVRLYGSTSSTASDGLGLAPYLTLAVTRGSFSGAAPAGNGCAGFVADTDGPDDPVVLFNGNLADYPSSWNVGLVDPDGSWSDGDSAVYRFTVTAQDDDRAQGQDATAEFDFEARNL